MVCNAHCVEQWNRYFSLGQMLWLIFDSRLTTPTNHQQHGHCVDRRVSQGEKRIDGIAQA